MSDNLTKSIMNKVVNLERRRVILWRVVFWLVVGVLVVIALDYLFRAVLTIQERGTLDLLTLFQEDREVIAEFWQDTLTTFWEELPQRRLMVAVLTGGIMAVVLLLTRRSRKVLKKKLEQLRQYSKSK